MTLLSIYVDANVMVAWFVLDPLNERADAALRRLKDELTISDFTAAEFSSVIARRVRTGDLDADEARTAFANFDNWCARYARRVELVFQDVACACDLVRRLDLVLRTPDAIHIAMVRRTGCQLLTFDKAMARAACALGLETASG